MAKYALLVGINKHLVPNNDLQGCVNDVLDMKEALQKWGFHPDNIRVVLDERATVNSVLERLEWLIRQGKNVGDELVFHYAGHGSQMRDWDEDELKDGMDELICCSDMQWDDPLTDDKLKAIFAKKVKGVSLTVMLDCCHSGTGTRSVGAAVKGRHCKPPLDIEVRGGSLDLRKRNLFGVRQTADYGFNQNEMNHVLFAGASSHQTAADALFGSRPNGAFSYYLVKAMNEYAECGDPVSNRTVFDKAFEYLKAAKFEQTPELFCSDTLRVKLFLGGKNADNRSVSA